MGWNRPTIFKGGGVSGRQDDVGSSHAEGLQMDRLPRRNYFGATESSSAIFVTRPLLSLFIKLSVVVLSRATVGRSLLA